MNWLKWIVVVLAGWVFVGGMFGCATTQEEMQARAAEVQMWTTALEESGAQGTIVGIIEEQPMSFGFVEAFQITPPVRLRLIVLAELRPPEPE